MKTIMAGVSLGVLVLSGNVLAKTPDYTKHYQRIKHGAYVATSTGACSELGFPLTGNNVGTLALKIADEAVRDGMDAVMVKNLLEKAIADELTNIEFMENNVKATATTPAEEKENTRKHAIYWYGRCVDVVRDPVGSQYLKMHPQLEKAGKAK